MADSRTYNCPWCNHTSDASSTSCPACGAPVDVRKAVTKSGWTELPPIRDMAKIQFGQSVCQIEGNFVPVADFNLTGTDGVYFAHHLMLWKDDHAQISAMSLKGGWKRLFAGLPLVMTQAHGPGRIAFSKDKPGELVAIPLDPGQSVDVREHVFMIATLSMAYDWFQTGIWFSTRNGNDTETHYPIGMFMDRFTGGDAPGLLLLHGAGQRLHPHPRTRPDDPHQTHRASLQGPPRADASALRASARSLAILAQLGQPLPMAAPHRPRPGRGSIQFRTGGRSRKNAGQHRAVRDFNAVVKKPTPARLTTMAAIPVFRPITALLS